MHRSLQMTRIISPLPAGRHRHCQNLSWDSSNSTCRSPALSFLISRRTWANRWNTTLSLWTVPRVCG